MLQSVNGLTTSWTVQESNRGVGKIFRALQTGPEAHSAFCTTDTGWFPEVKRPGRGTDRPPLSSAQVANRLELYLRLLPVTAQPCHGVTFTFTS